MRALPRFGDFRSIVFFTGAGLSAESGIPTYRGRGGVWHEYDYREFACQAAFARDPDKVWEFHERRREVAALAEPNEGHRIIAEVQRGTPGTAVVTQNIDGLHQRAGATLVIELHGSLWRVRCDREGTVREEFTRPLASRRCSCGAALRPDIVWFGDLLDAGTVQEASRAIAACDLFVSVGTSGLVTPAADLPAIAARAGAVCVEVNPEETPVSGWYRHHLRGPASEMLPLLRD
ncbi:MAG: SIR2 family NAD-dependent protein deacylase [Planctomycetaceae bacterium]